MRERFGAGFFLLSTIPGMVVDWLVLASEIGGVAARPPARDRGRLPVVGLPVASPLALLMWKGNLGLVENGTALLGLVALAFVVAAVRLHPPVTTWPRGWSRASPGAMARILLVSSREHPRRPDQPYLFFFYSSGAIEDPMGRESHRKQPVYRHRGYELRAVLAFGVLTAAAMVFTPRDPGGPVRAGRPLMLTRRWAARTVPLRGRARDHLFRGGARGRPGRAYVLAQGFGWNYTLNSPPTNSARFSLVYTGMIGSAAVLMALGIDPLTPHGLQHGAHRGDAALVTAPVHPADERPGLHG
jgi:hypothetical protein